MTDRLIPIPADVLEPFLEVGRVLIAAGEPDDTPVYLESDWCFGIPALVIANFRRLSSSPSSEEPAMKGETPPCRVCGDAANVACYPSDHLEHTICVTCCEAGAEHHDGETGHGFDYDRTERDRVCRYCGQFARNTDYYDHWDEP